MEIGKVTDDTTFVDVKWDVPRGIDSFNCSSQRAFMNPGISCYFVFCSIFVAGALDSNKDIFTKVLFLDRARRLTGLYFALNCEYNTPKLISICFLFVFCRIQGTLYSLAMCLTLMKFSVHFLIYFLISASVSSSEVLGGKVT